MLKASDPTHPDFTTSRSPFYWLNRVAQGHAQKMDVVLKKIGLDVPRWRILTTLTEIQPASISLLAEHCAAKLSTMTKAIGRLEADGMVRTQTSAMDARVTEVRLTPKGAKIIPLARQSAVRIIRQTLEGIDDREVARLNGTLQQMLRNIHPM